MATREINKIVIKDSAGNVNVFSVAGILAHIPAATTSVAGIVQLYDGVDSTSTSLAATANAVKTAKDAADAAQSTADGAVTDAAAAQSTADGAVTAAAAAQSTADSAVTAAAAAQSKADANETAIQGLDTRLDVIVDDTGAIVQATSDTFGAVKTASAADVTAGTSGKVVDAAQLKAVADKLTGVYTYRGSVNTFADLPSTNVQTGDVYNVVTGTGGKADGINYAAVVDQGTITWDELGGIIDVSAFVTIEDAQSITGTKTFTEADRSASSTLEARGANEFVTKTEVKTYVDNLKHQVVTSDPVEATMTQDVIYFVVDAE